jgi:hypothetical protein
MKQCVYSIPCDCGRCYTSETSRPLYALRNTNMTESSFRNVVFWKIHRTDFDKDKMMDNVQKHNICTKVPTSQTLRSYWKERIMNRYELQFCRDVPQADVLRSTSQYEVEAFLFCVMTLDLLSSFLKQSRQDVRSNTSRETYKHDRIITNKDPEI